MRILFWAMTLIAPLVLAGCEEEDYSWRQKMTVAVETPEGVRSASSVVGIDATRAKGGLADVTAGSSISTKVRGEAVVVDLGQGRFFFALFKGQSYKGDVDNIAQYAFSDGSNKRPIKLAEVAALPLGASARPVGVARPLLVTFDDITKPETVRRVDPDDLAAIFGPGHALKSITLEITDEPVTEGRVEAVLGWLEQIWPNRLDGVRYGNANSSNQLASSLSANSFSTEIKR